MSLHFNNRYTVRGYIGGLVLGGNTCMYYHVCSPTFYGAINMNIYLYLTTDDFMVIGRFVKNLQSGCVLTISITHDEDFTF